MGGVSQRVQTSSEKTDECWGLNAQHGDYSSQHCVLPLKATETVDLKCSHHTREEVSVLEVVINLIVVIILQYIHIANHHVLYLKLTQIYMSIIFQ